ncbi:MAG: leucine-rich repeat domain-containing protein [Pirellulales bacterium]
METSSEEKQLPKPKRRWFQLRLRTLLVLVTLASVAFGWVGWELDRRRREKEVVAWVEKMGGQVYFHSPINERSWWEKRTDNWFGVMVWKVAFVGRPVGRPVSDLKPLVGLKKLEVLVLYITDVSDLSPLAGLKNLEKLCITSTPVSDLSSLEKLKNLETLKLNDTAVKDLTQFAVLKNLKTLVLRPMQLNQEQVQKIETALPDCDIYVSPVSLFTGYYDELRPPLNFEVR